MRFSWSVLRSVALSVLLFGPASASSLPFTTFSSLTESLYSVRLNGELISQGSTFLTDGSGPLYARLAELSKWRFPARPSKEVILFKGVAYVSLASFAGLNSRIEGRSQEVEITVPVGTFAISMLQVLPAESLLVTDAQSGYYLNYALNAAAGPGTPSYIGGLFDLGVSERNGASLRASAFADDLSHSARLIRLDTVWQIDNPDKHQSTRIGDFVTQPRSLGIPIRFGGLSFGTDFSTDPQFITFPTPNVNGLAALPSTVDVFLNNYQASSTSVQPGPYDIGSIPAVNGMNHAQMIVRDITGSEHVVTLDFYSSSALLKPGLSDYTVQVGAERLNYGSSGTSYGPSFLTGTWRQGISDDLTAEGHAETMGTSRDCGLNLTTLLNDSGTLSTGLEQSASPAGYGRLVRVGFEYRGSAFNLFTQFQAPDRNFWELGYSASAARPERLVQGGLSFEVRGNQISYTDIERKTWDGATQHISLLSVSRSIRHGSVSISFAAPTIGIPATLTAVLISSLAPSESAVASTSLQGARTSEDLAFQSGLPADGIGTALSVQEHSADLKSYFIEAAEQTQTTDASFGISGLGNRTAVAADLSGALVFISGTFHAARQVTGSYGLVSVPGYPGVGVLLNNRNVGDTDKHGDLVINGLEPYDGNLISVDPTKLPIGANIAAVNLTVVPSREGAVAVRFATQNAGGVRITVVDSDGTPLPPGSMIEELGTARWPVAEDGEVYLAGINPGIQTLTALGGMSPCRFTVAVPNNVLDLPNLGRYICGSTTSSHAGAH